MNRVSFAQISMRKISVYGLFLFMVLTSISLLLTNGISPSSTASKASIQHQAVSSWKDCEDGGGDFQLDWNDQQTEATTHCIGGAGGGVHCLLTTAGLDCNPPDDSQHQAPNHRVSLCDRGPMDD